MGYGGGEGDAEEAHLARHGRRHEEPRAARAPGREQGHRAILFILRSYGRYHQKPRAARGGGNCSLDCCAEAAALRTSGLEVTGTRGGGCWIVSEAGRRRCGAQEIHHPILLSNPWIKPIPIPSDFLPSPLAGDEGDAHQEPVHGAVDRGGRCRIRCPDEAMNEGRREGSKDAAV